MAKLNNNKMIAEALKGIEHTIENGIGVFKITGFRAEYTPSTETDGGWHLISVYEDLNDRGKNKRIQFMGLSGDALNRKVLKSIEAIERAIENG